MAAECRPHCTQSSGQYSVLTIIRHLVWIECVTFLVPPYTRVMYGIRQCNRKKNPGEIGAFFTEIFFYIAVVILNSNLHYQIFKFVIDNSDIQFEISLQHIQNRRYFDPEVICHQPICVLLHAILSGVGVSAGWALARGFFSSQQFWNFEQNVFFKFHFRLPSHKITTIIVFDTRTIRIFVWITQKLFHKSGI